MNPSVNLEICMAITFERWAIKNLQSLRIKIPEKNNFYGDMESQVSIPKQMA